MICPRCGNEWDVSKGPCSHCGLAIRMPVQTKSAPSSPLPLPNGTGPTNGFSSTRQPSGGLPTTFPQNSSQPAQTMSISQRGTTSSPGPLRPSTTSFSPNLPPPSTPTPGTPYSSRNLAPRQDSLGTRPTKGDATVRQSLPEVASSTADILSKNPTPRTPLPPRVHRFTDPLPQDRQLPQSPIRSPRLVSDMLREQVQNPQPRPLSQQTSGPLSQPGLNSSFAKVHMLLPGTILHNGRYRLHQLQDRQDWAPTAFEAMWIGQDAQHGASQVMICEVVLPNLASITTQSKLRAATMTLATVSRHPRIPTLLDAFSEQERTFFVFETVDGESLLTRMQRTGRALPEQEVIECCLQIAEVLEGLSQQAPPLVHGLIRPEHIFVRYSSPEYILTHYSILLAGGATQFINLTERPSPYAAPELIHGMVDVRFDLYSLLATAYHLVTGSPPTEIGGLIPQAQRLNPNVSSHFDAILAKGLRPGANQRYQRPSELIQDLMARPSVNGSLVSNADRVELASLQSQSYKSELSSSTTKDSAAQALPLLLTPVDDVEERALLLPSPEELPPMVEGDDRRNTAIWLGILLLCMIIIVLASGRPF